MKHDIEVVKIRDTWLQIIVTVVSETKSFKRKYYQQNFRIRIGSV